MYQYEKGFIMLCNNFTESECLERNLFGDKANKIIDFNEIKLGDLGFLFNYDKDELIGIFQSCSRIQIDIERNAWKRKFPAQIKVKPLGELQRIKDATFVLKKLGVDMGQLATGVQIPYPVHNRNVTEKILMLFKNS